MTIETDFCDHWKTSALIDKCGYQAVLCLIRLWSLCQTRKTDSIPADKLERLARWDGEQNALFNALKVLQFIEPTEGENVVMHDFSKVNCKMFANWKNGRKGGRPKNPTETQRKPNYNPTITQTAVFKENQENSNMENSENQENPNESQYEISSVGLFLSESNPILSNLSNAKKEREKDKEESFPPPPLYKEEKGKRERTPLYAHARAREEGDSEMLSAFRGKLQESLIPKIDDALMDELASIYSEWELYRAKSKNKLTQFGVKIDAKNILKCISAGMTADDIRVLFEQSISAGHRGWFWPEKLLKFKAYQKNNKKNTPPPVGVPVGAWNAGEMI